MTDRTLTAALAGSATVAATAPPIRRSQPWHWVLHTTALDLYVDPRGQLTREETLLTCGGAVHRARVALAADGLAARIDLLPDVDPDHVATITPTGRIPVTQEARRLVATAQSGSPPVATGAPSRPGPGALRPLVEAAHAEGAELRLLERGEIDQLAAATPLLARSARAGVSRDDTTVYAVLYGAGATPQAWLRAGQALSAIDLGARLAGLSVVASASVVELSRSREVLRRLLPVGTTAYLALRVEPAAASNVTTQRRAV